MPLLLALYACWGSAIPAMKLTVETMSPLRGAAPVFLVAVLDEPLGPARLPEVSWCSPRSRSSCAGDEARYRLRPPCSTPTPASPWP